MPFFPQLQWEKAAVPMFFQCKQITDEAAYWHPCLKDMESAAPNPPLEVPSGASTSAAVGQHSSKSQSRVWRVPWASDPESGDCVWHNIPLKEEIFNFINVFLYRFFMCAHEIGKHTPLYQAFPCVLT